MKENITNNNPEQPKDSNEKQEKINTLKSKLDENNGIESQTSIEIITQNIDSPRFKDLKDNIDKVLEEKLKYDFLDTATKNIVKLGIIDEIIKSPINGTLNSIGSDLVIFFNSLANLDFTELDKLNNKKSNDPKIEGKVGDIEKYFTDIITRYDNKFKEINTKLNSKTKKEKQAIISNIDAFRDPNKVSKIKSLKIDEINLNNTTKKEMTDEEKQKLAEYIVNLKENFEKMDGQLKIGDKTSEGLLNIIDSGGKIGEGIKNITEFLLKIPFLGKFIAIFLGLDPENPVESLNETLKSHQILKGLKYLGKTKESPGTEPFQDIDLSEIQTNLVKKELKELEKEFPELNKGNASDFWKKAFNGGYEKDGVKINFEMTTEQKKDNKIDNKEFIEILKTGIKGYNKKVEEKKNKDSKSRIESEKIEKTNKINTLNTEISQININIEKTKKQIQNINDILNKKYEQIDDWDDIFNIGDINDVKTQDIINGDNFGNIISKEIGESDYNRLPEKDKELLDTLFFFIKEYFNKKNISSQLVELKDFIKENETGFNTFLKEKKTNLEEELKQKEINKNGKEKEKATLEGSLEKYNLANNVGEKIEKATDGTSLLNGIDIGNNKKISFNKDNQELIIGNDKYKINLKFDNKDYNLKDIKITNSKVEFVPDVNETLLKIKRIKNPDLGLISKNTVITGIKELILNGKYEYKKDEIIISFEKR